MSRLVSFILKMMMLGGSKTKKEIDRVTLNPVDEQEKLLKKILKSSASSALGKEYEFDNIKNIKDFQDKFPLTNYDFFSKYIERMMSGENNVLTSSKIIHYNVTSGTLGNPKKIPVTNAHVNIFSKINAKYLNYLAGIEIGKDWTKYKGLSLAEGTYETLPTGVTVGCASSLHTAKMGKIVPFLKRIDSMDMMYTSPREARQPIVLGSYTRYLHALFALRNSTISYGNVTFSSYLLEVMRYIEMHWESICDDIENGKINSSIEIPEEVKESVEKKLKPMPERAKELRRIFSRGFDEPFVPYVWPGLKFFICVAGAGFQIYTDKLKNRYLGNDIKILYLGLSASEAMISVPLSFDNPNSVLLPNATLYEFIPVVNGERDLSDGIKLINELEIGKQYEVVISNVSGLFRYQMKDVIEVTGMYNNTPTIQFVNRSGFAINMYAEKTSEKALHYAATNTANKLGLDLYDYVVCPLTKEDGGKYVFMYEFSRLKNKISRKELVDTTEHFLREANPVYGEVRDDGTCQEMEVRVLQEETFMLYKDLMVMKGASAAQLKPFHVTSTPFQQRFFFGLVDDVLED